MPSYPGLSRIGVGHDFRRAGHQSSSSNREQGKQNEPFQRHGLAAKPDNLVGATPVHVWFSSATTDLPPPLT